jgi:hypothetical protein
MCNGGDERVRGVPGGGRGVADDAQSAHPAPWWSSFQGSILLPPLLPQPSQRTLEASQREGEPLGMQGCQHRCVTGASGQGRFQVVENRAQPGLSRTAGFARTWPSDPAARPIPSLCPRSLRGPRRVIVGCSCPALTSVPGALLLFLLPMIFSHAKNCLAWVEQLEPPELVVPVFGLCFGWPAEESPAAKPRQRPEMILHRDVHRDPEPRAPGRLRPRHARIGGRARQQLDPQRRVCEHGATQGKKREHMLAWLWRRDTLQC